MTSIYHMQEIDEIDLVATEVKQAFEMTDTTFRYRCPCKKGFHIHGNGGDPFTNRVEYRSSHCKYQSRELEIHITDKTTRKLKKQKSKSK